MRSMSILLRFKHLLSVRSFCNVLFSLFTITVWSQSSVTVISLASEKVRGVSFLGKDILDNSYWISGNVIKKTQGGKIFSFQDFALGQIHCVDFVNPVQLGLYYKDYNTWVVLDENLVLINRFDFSKLLSTYEISFVANSVRNTFWVVDEMGKSVNRYDPRRGAVNKLYTLVEEDVKKFYSDVNNLFWVTEDNRLKGVDIYGNKILDVYIPEHDLLQILNLKSILYSYNNELFYVDFETNSHSKIILKSKSISGFFFNTQKLSIFGNRILNNYQLKLS